MLHFNCSMHSAKDFTYHTFTLREHSHYGGKTTIPYNMHACVPLGNVSERCHWWLGLCVCSRCPHLPARQAMVSIHFRSCPAPSSPRWLMWHGRMDWHICTSASPCPRLGAPSEVPFMPTMFWLTSAIPRQKVAVPSDLFLLSLTAHLKEVSKLVTYTFCVCVLH